MKLKYLGILIEDLSWQKHIRHAYETIVKFTGIFVKIRMKLPKKILKELYFATVYPHLLYGHEIYANVNRTNSSDLIVLNNKLLRILQFRHKKAHMYLICTLSTTLYQ